MNGGLSILGLLGVAVAVVAAVAGWRHGNGFLFVIGALMLAVAARNTFVYVRGKRR